MLKINTFNRFFSYFIMYLLAYCNFNYDDIQVAEEKTQEKEIEKPARFPNLKLLDLFFKKFMNKCQILCKNDNLELQRK